MLWPGRPKPMGDELLSSWVCRLAEENGLRYAEFCRRNLPAVPSNRYENLDLCAGEEHCLALSRGSGVPVNDILALSLRSCADVFSRQTVAQGTSDWLLPSQVAKGSRGWQWCKECVEDSRHLRREWRLTFVTVCSKHLAKLVERCDDCRVSLSRTREDPLLAHEAALRTFVRCNKCETQFASEDGQVPRLQAFQSHLLRKLWTNSTQSQEQAAEHTAFFRGLRLAVAIMAESDLGYVYDKRKRPKAFEFQSVHYRFDLLATLADAVGQNYQELDEVCASLGGLASRSLRLIDDDLRLDPRLISEFNDVLSAMVSKGVALASSAGSRSIMEALRYLPTVLSGSAPRRGKRRRSIPCYENEAYIESSEVRAFPTQSWWIA